MMESDPSFSAQSVEQFITSQVNSLVASNKQFFKWLGLIQKVTPKTIQLTKHYILINLLIQISSYLVPRTEKKISKHFKTLQICGLIYL